MKSIQINFLVVVLLFFTANGIYPGQISLPREVRTQLTGTLWNTVGTAHKIEGGYVFALSVDRQEVLGYARTGDTREYGYGRFDIYDLPGSGAAVLVGFHPHSAWNMAIRRVPLTGGYQDIKLLDTQTYVPDDSPGIARGDSKLALLALAGWIADSKRAADHRNEVTNLSRKLMDYAERNPLPPRPGPGQVPAGPGFERFRITTESYPETADWDQVVRDNFGSGYRVADWNDLVEYHNSGGDILALFSSLGLREHGSSAFVTSAGRRMASGRRHYFASRHEGKRPGHYLAHQEIGGHQLSLGSWFDTRKPILVVPRK